tara:strand:- start:649 stop:1194 length:546 start_codon:yes stop_codon:yes gene_type:complete
MSKFVKKVGKVEYYEIEGIRASGIIPYYVRNNSVMILINQELRNNKLVHNIIGGKVDKYDKKIEHTMIREFNEETGFLMSDIIRNYSNKVNFLDAKIYLQKPKYLLGLLNVSDDKLWNTLPEIYNKIFDGIELYNKDSEKLLWVDLFEFEKNRSYLLSIAMDKLKSLNSFRKYNQKPLFID